MDVIPEQALQRQRRVRRAVAPQLRSKTPGRARTRQAPPCETGGTRRGGQAACGGVVPEEAGPVRATAPAGREAASMAECEGKKYPEKRL